MDAERIIAVQKGVMQLTKVKIEEPAENEVQVRAAASVVSPGTERAFILAKENTCSTFPQNVGYSSAGVVEKIGKDVTGFNIGDRVAGIMFHQSRGNIAIGKVVPIPDEVSFTQASFVRIGVICMQGVRKARIELGESCLIIGMGLIGQIAMQLAKANGAYPIICVDQVESKLELARKNGADVVINSKEKDWIEQIMAATLGKGAQVVLECTGYPAPISSALEVAAKYGRVIILGSTRGNTEVNFYRDVHKKSLTIIGAHISGNPVHESFPGYWTFTENAKTFLNFIKCGRVNVDTLISEKLSYKDYEKIYNRVLSGDPDYITTVIDWQ